MGDAWHSLSAEEVLTRLGSAVTGLSAVEAAKRLAHDGPNALEEGTRLSVPRMLLDQFKSLIVWILIGAGLASIVLGDTLDAAAILAIVVLNAAIGLYQQFKAAKSIAALKKMTSPQAKVRRDGQVISIAATGVVAGDILMLEAGDVVAADARVIAAPSLRTVESALTGESESVSKAAKTLERGDVPLGDRENMVFMGTSVAGGTGRAVVVATAMRTELGRIANLIEEAGSDDGTPLQRKLDAFGRILIWVALGIIALLFGIGVLRGTALLELLRTSVGLAVAAIPEGLPAVVTVALSLGVMRMARRGALMRKLAAVETLGSTSVICTDKTGTLTAGEMTVRAFYVAGQTYEVTGEGYGPAGEVLVEGAATGDSHVAPLRELAQVLLGSNNAHLTQTDGAWTTVGDPTEGALLVAGTKAGGDRERLEQELIRQHELPFDSDRKRSTVIRRSADGRLLAFTNGAPGGLLELSESLYTTSGIRPLTAEDRKEILAHTSRMAKQGLRVLAAASRELDDTPLAELTPDAVERALVFIGLTGMYDPPRAEAKDAIVKCQAAGIRVVMITGDHPETATAIAREIGIGTETTTGVTGVELDTMPDEELRRRVPDVAVYARVTAEHKLRIVRALRANGAVVAMTGDGVNDAPAIKGADIGIAMGRTGTEVTKQAADMIITDDNFATIVIAVEEGRGIYDNIRKTLQYLLAGNTGELLLIAICVVVGLPMPLLPIHLLWINLVTDGAPALCLANDPIAPDVMQRSPRGLGERIMDHGFLATMAFTGFLTAGVTFLVYLCVLRTGSLEAARTSAFAVLVFAELLRSFGARSETTPVWRISLLSNRSLVIVVAASIALQVWSQHNVTLGRFLKTGYLSFADCLVLFALGTVPLVILELRKLVRRHRPTGRNGGAGVPA